MITDILDINLVKELGLDNLSPENKKDLVDKMIETVEGRINLEVLSLLSPEEKIELDKVLDSDKDLLKFLREKIENFDGLVMEIIANFKAELLQTQKI